MATRNDGNAAHIRGDRPIYHSECLASVPYIIPGTIEQEAIALHHSECAVYRSSCACLFSYVGCAQRNRQQGRPASAHFPLIGSARAKSSSIIQCLLFSPARSTPPPPPFPRLPLQLEEWHLTNIATSHYGSSGATSTYIAFNCSRVRRNTTICFGSQTKSVDGTLAPH